MSIEIRGGVAIDTDYDTEDMTYDPTQDEAPEETTEERMTKLHAALKEYDEAISALGEVIKKALSDTIETRKHFIKAAAPLIEDAVEIKHRAAKRGL